MNSLFTRFVARIKASAYVFAAKTFYYDKIKYARHNLSFSQEGEDRILNRIFETKSVGYYVDVGSHHPQRFSNTYLFYLRGWHGINITRFQVAALFDELRHRDISLKLGYQTYQVSSYIIHFKILLIIHLTIKSQKSGFRFAIISKSFIKVWRLVDVLIIICPGAND